MNDQTSPTADGQGPGSSPWRNPFEEPQSAHGLPGVPDLVPGPGADGPGGPGGYGGPGPVARPGRPPLTAALLQWRSDLLVAAVLVVTGAVFGVLSGLAWYRFAPTVWLTLPANAVPQVTSGIDQSALLVAPEAKGIASVDGYYFVFTAVSGLLLGVLGFFLARRGLLDNRGASRGERDRGERDGAAIGAWAGVLLGGFAASTLAAALGRWVSMPDPLTVLHTIAAGHNFHAPVALHAQGLYLAAPLLGLVLFLALTAAFTKPTPPPWQADGGQAYFTTSNPYGFQPGVNPAGGAPQEQPQPPQQQPQPAQQPGENGPDAGPEANSGAPQADNSLG
ncbi:hypothetical protein Caci_5732 [Catenulispora acidiphila DSM 44928]|uniref:DUF2567 domain-containing protein n=1 Tax=Catenulispora acidiphila (strain DSM 44928 / JCM 14897 / NBRC 102108 / NRRL B-24433 / ID139908) TaxID=479433 RepID=C7QCE2_CATAD|nr:TMEM165/GDT1 family protein [Catenulispora acidiphila]ACU74590.1 hypothetical protein Caci_5732 [Catenulispora acidiphila DSM 44928]